MKFADNQLTKECEDCLNETCRSCPANFWYQTRHGAWNTFFMVLRWCASCLWYGLLLYACVKGRVVLADDAATNYVSNIMTVRAWERHHVQWDTVTGALYDPFGRLSTYAEGAAMGTAASSLTTLMDAANASMTNAMQRFYASTNLIPTSVVFIAGDESTETLTDSENIWGYVVEQSYSQSNDVFKIYFSESITNAPVVNLRYMSSVATNWVQGTWSNWTNKETVVSHGYIYDCRVLTVPRPQGMDYAVYRFNKWMHFGGRDGFSLDGINVLVYNTPTVTRVVTNGTWRIVIDNGAIRLAEELENQQ